MRSTTTNTTSNTTSNTNTNTRTNARTNANTNTTSNINTTPTRATRPSTRTNMIQYSPVVVRSPLYTWHVCFDPCYVINMMNRLLRVKI